MKKNKIIIGNWKMKLGFKESLKLANDLVKKLKSLKGQIVLMPDFSALDGVGRIINGFPLSGTMPKLSLGAQAFSVKDRGAYTGEVSPLNLKELGVKYALIGHSERREYFNETDEIVNLKLQNLLSVKNIIPVVCIGEKLGEDRLVVFRKQLLAAFKGVKIEAKQKIIVAYEPLWAISTGKIGKVITVAEAVEAHLEIRKILEEIYSPAVFLANFSLLYGGSVDEKNAQQFKNVANIDGVLVGGASLDAGKFLQICAVMLR
jgi:triosephosphate isomerase